MKNILMMMTFALSVNSFAGTTIKEFDQDQEIGCHNEVKAQGCVTKEGTEDPACREKKLEQLSETCKNMHLEKKKIKS